ncbi:PEP-CTERM sorting domain-containing protein [bacterium]|nr:MAG: PEP-CTERM sorting domain-containing protein [bacterium]
MFLSNRSLFVAALSMAALSAQAVDAFSNLDPAPDSYNGLVAYDVSPNNRQGFQFTAVAGGMLTGFQVAMNNLSSPARQFNFSLYEDSGSDTLGTFLFSWNQLSTGVDYNTTRSALVSIDASGSGINIVNGAKYWVVANAELMTFWNTANSGTAMHLMGDTYIPNSDQGAYSVQVEAVPEPASMVALGLGAVALLRRRRAA